MKFSFYFESIEKIKNWSICFNYFIFAMNENEEDGELLHLVDLEENNALIKIREFGTGNECRILG